MIANKSLLSRDSEKLDFNGGVVNEVIESRKLQFQKLTITDDLPGH